jgi:hypothetical protein
MILYIAAVLIFFLFLVWFFAVVGRLKWCALISDEALLNMGLGVLLHRHSDFIKPLQWMPRWVLAFIGPQPRYLYGSSERTPMLHLDIPPNGTWVFCWPLYFALKTKGGLHWRIGFRPDYEAIPGGAVDYFELDIIFPRNMDRP